MSNELHDGKTSIPMTQRQIEVKEELYGMIKKFEDRINTHIPSDPNMIAEDLSERIAILGMSTRMAELSTAMIGWAKGMIAEEIMADPKLANMKADLFRAYLHGRLAEYSAIEEKTKRAIRSMEVSIEAMRSILSYEKEQMKMQGNIQN